MTEAENYYFSSARNYADLDNLLDVFFIFIGFGAYRQGLQIHDIGDFIIRLLFILKMANWLLI